MNYSCAILVGNNRINLFLVLGAAMALGPNILPVFEQLGLMEEFNKIALPVPSTDIYDDDMNKMGSIVMKDLKKM